MLPRYTRVEMARNTEGRWEVQTPEGPLDTSKSRTDGLQEAISYAADHGLDWNVQGGVFEEGTAAARNAIVCRTSVRIPPLEGAYGTIRGVTVDFTAGGAEDGFLVDSLAHSELTFQCSVHYRGTGAAFHVHPRNPLPRASTPMAIDSKYNISRLRIREVAGAAGLRITGPNVARNRFELIEIEGELAASTLAPLMHVGIDVGAEGAIFSNWFAVQSLLRAKLFGIADNGTGNQYHAHVEPVGLEAVAVRAGGNEGLFTLDLSAGQGSFGTGIMLPYGVERNVLLIQRNDGGRPIHDASGNTSNRFL